MSNLIKRAILIGTTTAMLMISAGCTDIKMDYHASNDDAWLTEQVQKGKLTKEQADKIRTEQNKLEK